MKNVEESMGYTLALLRVLRDDCVVTVPDDEEATNDVRESISRNYDKLFEAFKELGSFTDN